VFFENSFAAFPKTFLIAMDVGGLTADSDVEERYNDAITVCQFLCAKLDEAVKSVDYKLNQYLLLFIYNFFSNSPSQGKTL
jgi:hypothetical protein